MTIGIASGTCRVGSKPQAMRGPSSRLADALRQALEATGTAAFQSFRAASPASCDAPHHGDTGSEPKALKGRPYESLLSPFGMSGWGPDRPRRSPPRPAWLALVDADCPALPFRLAAALVDQPGARQRNRQLAEGRLVIVNSVEMTKSKDLVSGE